jgi:hypothetical protein
MVEPESRFRRLPEPIRLEDTVASQETHDALDPEGGRDTDLEFLLRYN